MKKVIDYATVVGILLSFVLVYSAIAIGGDLAAFVDVPSILLVIFGTITITTIGFSLQDMASTPNVVIKTILYPRRNPAAAAREILRFADKARTKGVLALEEDLGALKGDRVFFKSMRMLVDGVPAKELESILHTEISAIKHRHHQSAEVLRKAGEISPAMGLIGTLIGLVQMLANLDDPSSIGPAMGLALLTTFYGAILSNVVFLPLATKLERNSQEEEALNTLYMMGVVSISKQENPRRLEMMLNTILPPASRVKYFD